MGAMEVHQQPQPIPGRVEVSEDLIAVSVVEAIYRLEFDDEAVLDQEIHLPRPDGHALVEQLDGDLPLELDASRRSSTAMAFS